MRLVCSVRTEINACNRPGLSLCYRKQDCSPAESAAVVEEVRALEALLKQV